MSLQEGTTGKETDWQAVKVAGEDVREGKQREIIEREEEPIKIQIVFDIFI